MTDTKPDRSHPPRVEPQSAAGLRLRLWLACLGGALVAAAGIWWVIGTRTGPGISVDLAVVVSWLGAVAGAAVVTGAGFALWLDRVIVGQARGLSRALATQQVAQLRGLPGASGWGELSQLTQQIQATIARHRHAERAADELGLMRDQLTVLRDALDRWAESERWVELRPEGVVATPLVEALNRGLRRLDEVRDQNLEAARQIAGEMEHALESARESAEQAERGFVESTALLTTVRELQRLGQELSQTVPAGPPAPGDAAEAGWVAGAREAIEELVAGSAGTVEHLAAGLRKVEEISEQVTLLANRATLIALDSSLGGRVVAEGELVDESRRLALDVRVAVDRTARLARELEAEVAAAASQMRGVRERVALKLERVSVPSGAVPSAEGARATADDRARLLERVREMVQDATRKGERLSATGERASRAAEALLRGLEAETREMAGLLARLAPVPEGEAEERPRSAEDQARGLRLLSPRDLLPDSPEERRTPGASEEPR